MTKDAVDSTKRFSNRVENYVKFRPGYPPELLSFLTDAIGLTPAWTVADVGSGTGISAEKFLRHGNEVWAVEPNAAMRAAAEQQLGEWHKFHSLAGTAAQTGLADASVELVSAFQAFHWFDPDAARREFARILKPGGWTVLVWNDRRTTGTPFLEAYEQLLIEHGTDYQRVRHSNVSAESLAAFFAPSGYREHSLANEQVFDLEGVKGRLLSSSYAPAEGEARHESMMAELRRIFEKYQEGGKVRFVYDTRVYWGGGTANGEIRNPNQ
jgi:ubiquinone/menaquinone biosynthesis C-methylase UbiE